MKHLLSFTAAWCGPCRKQKAINAKIKDLHIKTVDVDKEPELTRKFNVRAYPTNVFMDGDKETARYVGIVSEKTIRKHLQ